MEANSHRLTESVKNKMWLSHYNDWITQGWTPVSKFSPYKLFQPPEDQSKIKEYSTPTGVVKGVDFNWHEQAEKDGFKGFLKVGQVLEF